VCVPRRFCYTHVVIRPPRRQNAPDLETVRLSSVAGSGPVAPPAIVIQGTSVRILSVSPDLASGGMQRAVEIFSRCYHRAGHRVAALGWRAGGWRVERLRERGIEVFVGGADLARAVSAANAFDPQLIHIHRVGVHNAIETEILRRLRRRHRRVIETNVFGRVDRSDGADFVDVHMLLSDWCLWRWRRWLGSDSNRVGVVVPNPIETSSFAPAPAEKAQRLRSTLGIPADAFVCGRIGQADAAKWHPATFSAFERLARVDPTAHLVLMGLPTCMRHLLQRMAPDIRRRIVELPTTERDEELVTAYTAFDCFLHAAAIGESFGYVLAEAMLCECPVVTASTPPLDNSQVEVVTNMIGGPVAGSVNTLSDALMKLRQDADLRSRLEPHLRRHVISRFEAEAVSAKALELATLALEADNKSALREKIENAPHIRSAVKQADIHRLLSSTLGGPSRAELAMMRVRHLPSVQRHIDARLSRRLGHTDALSLDPKRFCHRLNHEHSRSLTVWRPRGAALAALGSRTVAYIWLGGTPILCYHSISNHSSPKSEFTVSASALDRQMRLLRWLGFQSLTLQELTRAYEHGEAVENGVVITFDDGYHDTYTQAAPILSAHGFTATVFVVTDYVGRRLRHGAQFATWDELRRLRDAGWEIGLHSATHADLTAVDNGKLDHEVLDAARVLEHRLGEPVWSMAYPWGKYTPAAIEAVMKCGARAAVTVSQSLANRRSPRYALPRCAVRRSDNLLDILGIATTGYSPKSLVRFLRQGYAGGKATTDHRVEEHAWWRR